LIWLRGLGGGQVAGPVYFLAGNTSPYMADVNRDGLPDLLFITPIGVNIILGKSQHRFHRATGQPN